MEDGNSVSISTNNENDRKNSFLHIILDTNWLYFFLGFLLFSFLFIIVFFLFLKSFLFSNYQISQDKKNLLFLNKDVILKNINHHDENFTGKGNIEVQLVLNDNLFNALLRNGFEKNNINDVLLTMNKKVNLKDLKEKQKFFVDYTFNSNFKEINVKKNSNFFPKKSVLVEKRKIEKIVFKLPNGVRYSVERNKEKYILHIEKLKFVIKTHIISGTIQNSVFADAMVSDINATTLYNVLNEYAFLIDFQRDIHLNDKFVFIIEKTIDADGDFVNEKVIYSNLILSGKKYEIFNFHGKFYDRDGKSIQKNLLKTPIDGARVSSGFSQKRKHPILGYTRAHTGIDLAAATGTPIYSAGDGVVSDIQLNHRAYGKFITIRHNREYSTRYAHMSRVAHLKVGQRVKQRQVIGYVGMTGLATGPHLHYEVMRYGKHINPKNVKAVETKKLGNDKIGELKNIVKNIDEILSNI